MAQTQHAALATLSGAGNHDGRAIMATWKKCTGTQREIIFINVDVIAAMRWIETRKHTELYLGGGDTMLIVNETPEFIRNTAPTV
jgi:hypothetical protein